MFVYLLHVHPTPTWCWMTKHGIYIPSTHIQCHYSDMYHVATVHANKFRCSRNDHAHRRYRNTTLDGCFRWQLRMITGLCVIPCAINPFTIDNNSLRIHIPKNTTGNGSCRCCQPPSHLQRGIVLVIMGASLFARTESCFVEGNIMYEHKLVFDYMANMYAEQQYGWRCGVVRFQCCIFISISTSNMCDTIVAHTIPCAWIIIIHYFVPN